MKPFALIKWPEVYDFRRHRATVGVSSSVKTLRKVSLYANKLWLPMVVKTQEHMLSNEGKMEKVTLLGEISAHMQLYNRQMMFGKPCQKLSAIGVAHSHSFILFMIWNIMPCCSLYSNAFSSKILFFSNNEKAPTTKNKDSLFCHWAYILPEKIFFCDKIDKISKGYDDQSYSPSIRSTMTMSKNCKKLKIFHISDMSK